MMGPHKSEYAAILAEMRRLARSRFESVDAIGRLRSRIDTERVAMQQRVFEEVARQTHIDLRAILEHAKRGQEQLRREIAETLAKLESQARQRAHDERDRFHQIRKRYRQDFTTPAGSTDTAQLKFRDVLYSTGDATPGRCPYLGTGLFGPWLGPDTVATADIAASTDSPGMWLHPVITIDTNDCDDASAGVTFQELTYRLDAPATSFGVENIRLDLIANGVASAHFGDLPWFEQANPYYDHTHVSFDAYIAQHVNGEWSCWPLVADDVFVGRGENVMQVRAVLSAQTYPANFFIRGADIGGGELLCMLEVRCSAKPLGNHAHIALDFGAASGHGMFVGGVALIGTSA